MLLPTILIRHRSHLFGLFYFRSALRKLIQKAPTLVNVAKSDGFAALHIATINGFKSTAEILISTVSPTFSRILYFSLVRSLSKLLK